MGFPYFIVILHFLKMQGNFSAAHSLYIFFKLRMLYLISSYLKVNVVNLGKCRMRTLCFLTHKSNDNLCTLYKTLLFPSMGRHSLKLLGFVFG